MRHRLTLRQQEKRKSVHWLLSNESHSVIPDTYPLTKNVLADLETKISGKIVFPWSPGYETDRQEFDDLYPTYPLLIVYVASLSDIRECLTLAQANKLPLAIRSGGHSLAGYSVCEGIVLDMSQLKSVYVDPNEKFAVIDPGANFGDIYPAIEPYNLHMPTGDCPTVCNAGFTMGGGYGTTSRNFGMGCDNVLEMAVMLADGSIVVANKNQNTDLFWALRGGTGGNFGILLRTKYRLHPLELIYGAQIRWPVEADPSTAAQVLFTIQEQYLSPNTLPQLGIETVLSSDDSGNKTVFFCCTWIGDEPSFQAALKPLLDIPGYTLKSYLGKYSYVNEKVLDGTPDIPEDVMAFSRSAYIENALSQQEWYNIVQYFQQNAPNQYTMIDMEAYGGQINNIAETECAFIHRQVKMDFFTEAFFDKKTNDRQKNEDWTENLFSFMKPYTNGHSYQNYPFRKQEDFRTAYWGKYYNQLVQIKNKYDPDNFFHYQQSIGPNPINDPNQVILFEPMPIKHETY